MTITSLVDAIVGGSALEVVRTPASLADLTKAATEDDVARWRRRRRLRVPHVPSAYDAVASLCKLLELLVPLDRPLSELVREPGLDRRPPRAGVPVGG